VNTVDINDFDGLATGVYPWIGSGMTITRNPQKGGIVDTTQCGLVTTDPAYNEFGELDTYTAEYDSNTIYSANLQDRDELGRITDKTEFVQEGADKEYDYFYDDVGRLVHVCVEGYNYSHYEYDNNSNRTLKTVCDSGVTCAPETQCDGDDTTGEYDDQDRLISYGNTSYTYTANGELETKTVGSDETTYDYDELGNLFTVDFESDPDITYIIDGRNRRIGKKVGGNMVQGFLYLDQLNPVAELDSNGDIVSVFMYGTRPNVPDFMVKPDGTTYRIISDHLGSPRLVVEVSQGTVVQRMDYDEFGNVTYDSNDGFQPFGFAGGLYDSDTGLVRFGARDYDPETGRWTSKDPILFGGRDVNLYGYAFTDPMNHLDTNGMTVFFGNIPPWIGPLLGSRPPYVGPNPRLLKPQGPYSRPKGPLPRRGSVFKPRQVSECPPQLVNPMTNPPWHFSLLQLLSQNPIWPWILPPLPSIFFGVMTDSPVEPAPVPIEFPGEMGGWKVI